ncbi:sigma-70 family RNA polymerase sigma factor [Rapidithrix thailandica]|uniref:Sigma-70 family RNA polymerase sigma factor n=1 Tax=Rapidithrix thailandica TaxID=413964 RepID=A0AAW9SC17_9BACT
MKCDIYKIWENYQSNLKSYVRKRAFNESDVNDIMQSVLIKITDYCETKNNVEYIKAWIYRITQNTIIDFYKKSKRISHVDLEYLQLQDPQDGYDENIYVWLHNFIDNLPTEYAVPLKLSDIEGKPQKKIAEQLGLTLTATKSRIQRARKKLREKFDECGMVEFSENQWLSYTVTKACCLR